MTHIFRFRKTLLRRRMAVEAGFAFILGLALPWTLAAFFFPSPSALPSGLIVASFAAQFIVFGVMFFNLPANGDDAPSHSAILVKMILVSAAIQLGMWISRGHSESAWLFFAMGLLLTAQAAAALAFHAVLRTVFYDHSRVARQATLAAFSLAMTALFWSREPIQIASQLPAPEDGPPVTESMTEWVMKRSPPMALASVWYHESSAAKHPERATSTRFDIIRGPLTYNMWIGSYQAAAYPTLFPEPMKPALDPIETDAKSREPQRDWGILLPLFVFGLSGILLADGFAAFRTSRRRTVAPSGALSSS